MLFSIFRRKEATSAPVARDRLRVLLAHERTLTSRPDLINALREEVIAVIRRHVMVEPDQVRVRMNRRKAVSTLKVDIEIPPGAGGAGKTKAA